MENSLFTGQNSQTKVSVASDSDVEPVSKYSPVTLQLSPATRILNGNPVEALIQSRSYALFTFVLF